MAEKKDQQTNIRMNGFNAGSFRDIFSLMFNIDNKKQSEFEQSLEKTRDSIKKVIKDSKAINDSYGNSLLAIGNNDKDNLFENNWFTNNTLNYTLWLSLYNDSWIFRRVVDKPAQDMVRCGINLQLKDERKDEILRQFKKNSTNFIQLLKWGGLFGGSIAVIMFDNLEDIDYSKPIDWNKVRNSKTMRMYITDRWYGCAPSYDTTVTDMTSLDYGKPETYRVTFADGKSLMVNHDYILRYEHRSGPPLIKNGQLQGWGYSEGAHIFNELSRDDKLKSSIQSLIDKALIEVIKMAGMRGLFMGTDAENQIQIQKRLEMVNWGRNFNSLTFLDKDDDYSMTGFSGLTGLSDLLEKNMWLVSAACDMQGVLYGDLKQGFSNDVDALKRYSDVINGRDEDYLRPVYEKYLWILYNIYGIEEKPEFEFQLLAQKEHEDEHTESVKKITEVLSTLLTDGVITTKIYAKAIQIYMTKGILSLDMDDKYIDTLDDVMKEEFE